MAKRSAKVQGDVLAGVALLSLTWLDTMATLLRRTTSPSLFTYSLLVPECHTLLSWITTQSFQTSPIVGLLAVCQSRQQQNVELRSTPVGKVEERLPTCCTKSARTRTPCVKALLAYISN